MFMNKNLEQERKQLLMVNAWFIFHAYEQKSRTRMKIIVDEPSMLN